MAKENRKYMGLPKALYVLLIAVCVLLVASIIFVIVAKQIGDSLNAPTPDTPPSIEVNPTPDTNPDDDEKDPEPVVIPQEVLDLVAEADFIAAGYDYDKAIAMLEASPQFSQYDILAEKIASYQEEKGKLVEYPTPQDIPHIFFHSLIADVDRAFDGDSDSYGYNMYMATIDEFKAIMEQMYEKGYVLVSPYDMAHEVTDETGTHFTYGKIMLPEGKKPFIMSQDDVNYYSYMIASGDGKNETPIFADTTGDGFAHKIIIGEDGFPTCEYMDADGNILVGDYDLVPVLERFIQEHPDFSYRGARAMLGVTGFEGVLGYRTKPSYEAALGSEAYAKEVADAKAVVQCLKDHGWLIVSHSYGHPPYGEIDYVDYDSNKWETTVQPIVGDTDIILYPHGSDINDWHNYTFSNYKFSILYEDGYRYFYGVDARVWNQLGENYFRGGRQNIDGIRMYRNPELLEPLFDVETVIDEARPPLD